MRKLVTLLIALRLAATLTLIFSPAFANTEDLAGWDVARFQAISDSTGQAYVDFEVEYPPGSLILIRTVTAFDDGPNRTVTTHRLLAASSLAVDLALALLLHRRWGRRASVTYLVIGTPLIFFGLVRFDLWAALLATIAAAALSRKSPKATPKSALTESTRTKSTRTGSTTTDLVQQDPAASVAVNASQRTSTARAQRTQTQPAHASTGPNQPPSSLVLDLIAGTAIAAGALIKIWPALLIVTAVATRRYRAAALAAGMGAFAGAIWLSRSGTDALDQVLSLRGATGWQIESVGGSITALFTDAEPHLQADAFRIGSMNQTVVTLSRALAIATALGLGWLASRSRNPERLAIAMLGSVAALLVTAPLLSPQFMLWLAPWAAMAVSNKHSDASELPNQVEPLNKDEVPSRERAWLKSSPTNIAVLVTGGTLAMTALILSIAGPPNLHETIPALALLTRDALLVVIVATCALSLRQPSG